MQYLVVYNSKSVPNKKQVYIVDVGPGEFSPLAAFWRSIYFEAFVKINPIGIEGAFFLVKVFNCYSNKTANAVAGNLFYSLEYSVKGVTKHKTGFIVLKY